jgi:hypothetical protein
MAFYLYFIPELVDNNVAFQGKMHFTFTNIPLINHLFFMVINIIILMKRDTTN